MKILFYVCWSACLDGNSSMHATSPSTRAACLWSHVSQCNHINNLSPTLPCLRVDPARANSHMNDFGGKNIVKNHFSNFLRWDEKSEAETKQIYYASWIFHNASRIKKQIHGYRLLFSLIRKFSLAWDYNASERWSRLCQAVPADAAEVRNFGFRNLLFAEQISKIITFG